MRQRNPTQKTIDDFSRQWKLFRNDRGYYASTEMLADLFGPLLSVSDLKGKRVAEIGSGTGRVVNMLLGAGARKVIAIEPSAAFAALQRNTRRGGGPVTCVKGMGQEIARFKDLDYVFSIGVLHHIPEPQPVIDAAFEALRPGGKCFIWVYGAENNRQYIRLIRPLRKAAASLPTAVVLGFACLASLFLRLYLRLCRLFPLPLRGYMVHVAGKITWRDQILAIFDQLNPRHAEFYTRERVVRMLAAAGFREIDTHHRHGYSWSAVGTRPSAGRIPDPETIAV